MWCRMNREQAPCQTRNCGRPAGKQGTSGSLHAIAAEIRRRSFNLWSFRRTQCAGYEKWHQLDGHHAAPAHGNPAVAVATEAGAGATNLPRPPPGREMVEGQAGRTVAAPMSVATSR
jgi:hypothetical protein